MAAVHERIAARVLTPGARLPSIRDFARALGVSKSTVVEAYERLRAEGLVHARPGAGYFVSAPLAPLSLARAEPRIEREIDPLWISRQSMDASADVLKPGCGWLPANWMPEAGLRKALRKLARSDGAVLADYATAAGLPAFRELLSRRLMNQGTTAPVEQILLTESGTQAIDLLCRCLLEAGDTVVVDDPCYFNFHALLKAHRVRVVSVPYTPVGPDIAALQTVMNSHRPQLYITNSGIHNPTAATLCAESAHRVLSLAERYGVRIIEDDIFADLEERPATRLAALDGLNRVAQIGSFSKTVSASVRCGYIAAPSNWIEQLLDLKVAISFGNGNLAAQLTLAMLTDAGYRRHLKALRQRLGDARIDAIHKLAGLAIVPWTLPSAGMYLWCHLPEGIDAAAVTREAFANRVVLAPGNAFSLSRELSGFMRFNVAQCSDARVFEVLETAIDATRARR